MATSYLHCPHCDCQLFRATHDGSKLKARTSILVLHKGTNDVEINCPACSRGVFLPLMLSEGPPILRKAQVQTKRFVIRRS